MIVVCYHPFTGDRMERDLPVTLAQLTAWRDGTLIQQAMPHLSIPDREWLITGLSASDLVGEARKRAENNKIRALLWATRLMESLFTWTGYATTTTQALGWPRTGLLDRIDASLDSDTVPEEVKDAEAEFARQLLVANRGQDNEIEAQGISSIKAGSVFLQFTASQYNKVCPDLVYMMIPSAWFSSVRGRISPTRIVERAS